LSVSTIRDEFCDLAKGLGSAFGEVEGWNEDADMGDISDFGRELLGDFSVEDETTGVSLTYVISGTGSAVLGRGDG
jgi:hypothetical protein